MIQFKRPRTTNTQCMGYYLVLFLLITQIIQQIEKTCSGSKQEKSVNQAIFSYMKNQ